MESCSLKTFNQRLRMLREERGCAQKDVARAAGVSVASISNYESGQAEPGLDKLCAMADFFDVSTDWLLGRIAYRKLPLDIDMIDEATMQKYQELRALLRDFGRIETPDNLRLIRMFVRTILDQETKNSET